jgi:uncharacterized protein YoxC
MVVELWQVAVFLVAICFVILTIYLVGVLQGLNRTMEQVRGVVSSNTDNISRITKEIALISENATAITDDVAKDMDQINEAIAALNKTTQMVEETVQLSKDNVILPIMGLVNLGQGVKNVSGMIHRKK